MKKLAGFFIGLMTMVAIFAVICLVAIVYDTSDKINVRPYFFRLSQSISTPRSFAQVGPRRIRDWLIQKYVTEYFYIIPNAQNIADRMEHNGKSMVYMMSGDKVFKDWVKNVAPDMKDLAENGARRTVKVFDEILTSETNDYLRVDYELKTWYKPNDMTETPTTERGTMYLKLADTNFQVASDFMAVRNWLLRRGDPAAIFSFQVQDVVKD
ncbi:MAG: hypothetical protein J5611_00155 [Alphaproteobacteria bacterium]|nr:hypothetical protein [Alphaproteobacteria bacterium]